MIKKVNHIGIAVNDLEAAAPFYKDVLKLNYEGSEVVESQKVKVAFYTAGETRIELLEPTSPESPIAKFLEKKGEGIHHIAYEVEDVVSKLKELEDEGVRLIDKTPRSGAHGTSIAFIHPKAGNGVLVELCQPGKGE